LLGGSDGGVLDLVADEFVPAAGAKDASIALLMMGGEGWEEHVPEYVEPWLRRGAARHDIIIPGADGQLDLSAASARLRKATGIFIGGGHTPTYHRLYATEPIRGVIRERHQQGVPVAGLSAGALIAMATCVLEPEETGPTSPRIEPGLALVEDLVIDVHFTERERLPRLLAAMARTRIAVGLGIDGSACAVLEDGRLKRVLGRPIYQVTMTDFETRSHRIIQCDPGR
jgi:cyanophycinase